MSVLEHFNQGDLDAAIQAATADVKAQPSSAIPRVILAEMLCFAGDWERADTILDAAALIDPSAGVGISQFRHLLMAEAARRDFYTHGQMPTFLKEPDEQVKLRLQGAMLIREGDAAGAAKHIQEAEAARDTIVGTHGEQAFSDFRDGDDLLGPYIEVLSPDGRYFWIAAWEIKSLSFDPPARPLDLLFREAALVTESAEGQVFVPVLYAGVPTEDRELQLGRATDWAGGDTEPMRGIGQRVYFADQTELPVLELTELHIGGGGDA